MSGVSGSTSAPRGAIERCAGLSGTSPYEPTAMSIIVRPRGPGLGFTPHSLFAPRSHFQSSGAPIGDTSGRLS